MNKPVILTGLRANNDLTIGNYLGALLPMIDMAKKRAGEYQVNLFVPDLHSFTTPIDHSQLYAQVLNNIKVYVAAGLPIDHDDVYVYRQSFVPAHSELTWILDCFTGFGEMSRMTQFKDKSRKLQGEAIADALTGANRLDHLANASHAAGRSLDRVSVGLFNYPVLMAADILLYNASYVPVGDDQTQHLEFTRDIAERMNNQFGQLFTVPLPVPKQHEFFGKDQGLRIKDLLDPTKKMSKSDETGRGVVFLSDSPEEAEKKVMSAATDSYGEIKFDLKERPGISNLLQILALLTGKTQAEVNAEWEGQTRYGDFKKVVATAVSVFLRDFQARLADVDEQALLAKLEQSEVAMRQTAGETLLRAQKAVGLRA
ncbi:MAG TPA: tryptophan--tRNA ligase [Candidatus Saccharimonadales bacterium]